MDKQQAIEYLENVLENWYDFCKRHQPLVNAIEILLEETKNENLHSRSDNQ
jgi:hypothetical protein